ncbi:MAG: polysaccharide deacetylase family protein [Lentisphaerae bacterium]|nr:polysaccharide deacetylase family protein [Lentisphaerota bacterium]
MPDIHFSIQVACEATQPTIRDAALGERAIRGLAGIFEQAGIKATFVAIPSEMRAHAALYRGLREQGHEVGLHIHPSDQGYEEFLGVYGFEDQLKIISEAARVFEDFAGFPPTTFSPGYLSANDHTFPAIEAAGFRHGTVSCPTRDLPQCACVWGHSPMDVHYPHRFNRMLTGDVDFVEIPQTIDPESRMWGGAHPLDLRVELVDAKNHYYTMEKAVKWQVEAGDRVPVKYLKVVTHNIFEFGNPADFRRETLLKMIDAARRICEKAGCAFKAATTGEIARDYRRLVPR